MTIDSNRDGIISSTDCFLRVSTASHPLTRLGLLPPLRNARLIPG